jgi:beta-phosphoglucomutase-like phosphatase (HAD superfamily)
MSEAESKGGTQKAMPREVLFFELEYIATNGRQGLFDVVRQVLKAKDIDVTPAVFSRHGTASRPAQVVQALIDASRKNLTTGEQLGLQAEDAMKKFLAETALLNKELPTLIKAAQEKNIQVVAISAWPEAAAKALLQKLGLDALGVDLEAFDTEDPVFPRADHWLRMLKNRGQDTLPLIALVSSQAACKGALTAGATCIAVPDEYTAYEDFSGAKLVIDSLADVKASEILDLVSRR